MRKSMEWQNARRAEFILLHVGHRRQLRRSDLVREFGYVDTHASSIIKQFIGSHPSALVYDLSVKAYVPGPAFEDHHQALLETLKSRANQGASCG